SREAGRRELASLIGRFAPADGSHSTAVPGLMLHRHTRPGDLGCAVSRAALVIAAQGAKRVIVAGQAYEYDTHKCLITSIDLPILSRVTRASADEPYLCLSLT
ncbi:AraC family transcriptional regulator, partial [Burkholderia cenocepacia]|nr:AraC family transcriptional regulator [Burkholderia cenocepacia]MDR5670806.1 AraC family transcriptional regulator [Burkholderia cenocepacia]